MLIKEIKFRRPIDDVECTGKFYFNLDKRELLEMELFAIGGFQERIEKIKDSNDNRKIVEEFKEIIRAAYGEIGPDGIHFMKVDPDGRPLWRMFEQHPAYEQLYLELLGTPGKAAEFVNGILPTEAQNSNEMRKFMAANATVVE